MRKILLPVDLKEMTCKITDIASQTKTKPTTANKISVCVKIPTAANAPPKASEPVSPMKTLAGWKLNFRKPIHAPTVAAQKIAKSA